MEGSYTLVDGLPVIDLAQISQGDEYLYPVVKAILEAQYDTFLLRNYANRSIVDTLCTELSDLDQSQDKDFTLPGFDENFTGKWPLGNSVYVEQHIGPVNDGLPSTVPQQLRRLYTLLLKVAEFFSSLCVTAKSELKLQSSSSSQEQEQELQRQEDRPSGERAVKLTRYYRTFENEYGNNNDDDDDHAYGDFLPTTVLPNGDKIESITLHDYTPHRVPGLLSVFASGSGIQYRAIYSSGTGRGADDWCSIPEELQDCLVLHLGNLMRGGPNHSRRKVSPTLKIDLQAGNIVELNLLPSLESSNNADELLGVLMEEFPQVAERFYTEELLLSNLRNKVEFYKRMFAAFEAVVSLNLVTAGAGNRLQIDKLLPQVTNMLKDRRVTERDLFRMLYLWPESYRIERSLQTYRTSKRKWTISLPADLGLLSKDGVGSASRKSHYNRLADLWYDNVSQPAPSPGLDSSSSSYSIPEDVPLLQLTDQRNRRNRREAESSDQIEVNHKDDHRVRSKNYLSNEGKQFLNKERKTDTQENLLKRIRAKEQRQNQMLVERELQYQHFLDVKIEEVFNILNALEADKPYTETYISGLIVDSLLDSNNPIGHEEACEVLGKLYNLLSDDITLHTVEGGLKVYRWKKLDIAKFMSCMAKHISKTELMEVD